MDDDYERIGAFAGAGAAIIVFVGCWIYCIASAGFLLGVGLGWLPAGICASLAAVVVRYLWPVFAIGIAWLLWMIFKSN